ncbi:MAG: hypothetical protein GY854_08100 [Deltaproteobacteria bacterium]|nr:hypothetical protein [Deltaproteobacteria bacterium]
MNRNALYITLAVGLVLGIVAMGCGSKKPAVSASASLGGDAGPDEGEEGAAGETGDGLEPEADTGPVEYPEPPRRSSSGRDPHKFKVSVKKAYVLPLSEDGSCWDACSKEAKSDLVESLGRLSGDQFGSAAKALTTTMGAKGLKDALPDVYVNIDCGFGQEYATSRTSAENRLAAKWRGAKEILKLDAKDECAISVWDADEDEKDELLGDVVIPIIQKADNGTLIVTSEDEDLGQVFLIELFLDQLDGASVWGAPESKPTTPAATPSPAPAPAPAPKPDTKPAPSPGPKPKPNPGSSAYQVVVVKGNFKSKKDDGQAWDTKIPFIGKGGVLPDPFVQGFVNGYQNEHPFMETNTVQDKLYHVWNETGQADLKGSDRIHFFVFDRDKLDHDQIGECKTDTIDKLPLGHEIVIRNCSQVDFLVVKVIKK